MKVGVQAAILVPGVVKISSGNYGGKLGPFKAYLRDAIGAPEAPSSSARKSSLKHQKHKLLFFRVGTFIFLILT